MSSSNSSNSSNAPDFNKLFQENMVKLEKIKTDVESKITEKTTFSKTVMTELQDINKRLSVVRNKLNELKTHLLDLEGQIKNKGDEIIDKGNNCVGLEEEIKRLKDSLAESQKQQQDLESKYNLEFQGLVDEKDKLRTEKEAYETRNKELEAEMSLLKQQIEQLTKQLQGELTNLEKVMRENEELKRQHLELSKKIDDITKEISTLSSADTISPGDITALLQQIKDILANLEQNVDISATSSSKSTTSSSSSSSSTSSSKVQTVGEAIGKPLDEIFRTWTQPILERVVFNGKTFRELLQILYGKPAQNGADGSKFLKVFKILANLDAKNVDNIVVGSIFASYKITLNVNDLEGGKKTRKIRKAKKTKKIKRRRQKGGYTYSDKSKRRTFSSSPRSVSSSSSRMSSSPSSSQNDRPKRKSKRTL
jgi:predicted  nucleic acid-binding Zn-ribbon protein